MWSGYLAALLMQLAFIFNYFAQEQFWRDWRFYVALGVQLLIVNLGVQIRWAFAEAKQSTGARGQQTPTGRP